MVMCLWPRFLAHPVYLAEARRLALYELAIVPLVRLATAQPT